MKCCGLRALPAVCSTFTALTCLACLAAEEALSLPAWLSRLTNLRRLECPQGTLWSMPTHLRLKLPTIESLVSSATQPCSASCT